MMEKTGSIKFLNQEIKKLEKIRSELQEECLHKETSIKFITTDTTPRLICSCCEKHIGYPDKEQLDVFLTGR